MPEHTPLLQSELLVQEQVPLRQSRPVPQSLSCEHVVCEQVPATAPEQVYVVLGQSAPEPQGSVHLPTTPLCAPLHVDA